MLCAIQEGLIEAASSAYLPIFHLKVDVGLPNFLRHVKCNGSRRLHGATILTAYLQTALVGTLQVTARQANCERENGSGPIELAQSALKLAVHDPCIAILLEKLDLLFKNFAAPVNLTQLHLHLCVGLEDLRPRALSN